MSKRICSVEGCTTSHYSKGYCTKHLRRWERSGSTNPKPARLCSVKGCFRPHDAQGYCRSHYKRWKIHGDPSAFGPLVSRTDVLSRFWAKVLLTDGCWMWQGATAAHSGHGMFRAGRRNVLAHRFMYEYWHRKELGPNDFVLHDCGHAACVNPSHLYLGTQLQNMRDRDRHGTTARGERSGKAKLTNDQATEIRQRYAAGGVSMQRLAAEYKVGNTTIRSVIKGWTYSD